MWPVKKITRHVGMGHPILDSLLRRAKSGGGNQINFDIEYNLQQGGWIAHNPGTMTASTPAIVTKGTMDWRTAYVWCEMNRVETKRIAKDPDAVFDMFKTRVDNAVVAMKQRNWAAKIWTTQTSECVDSLVDAINDTATYAGITIGDLPSWKCASAEGIYTPGSQKGISPIIRNVQTIINRHAERVNEKIDMLATSGAVYERLKDQVQGMPGYRPIQGPDGARVGFTDLWIDNVPIVPDAWFADTLCSNIDLAGTTRATLDGHQAIGINWNYIDLIYLPGMFFEWDSEGFRGLRTDLSWANTLQFHGNIVSRSRRHHLRIYNIDPDQSTGELGPISVDDQMNLAAFAIPAEL